MVPTYFNVHDDVWLNSLTGKKRNQKGNQKLQFEEEQIVQWPRVKLGTTNNGQQSTMYREN
jgi:hypothetical protein